MDHPEHKALDSEGRVRRIDDSAWRKFMSMVEGRDYTFHLSEATERRFKSYIERSQLSAPDIMPPDEPYDEALKVAVGAVIDRGLAESEHEDGLIARFDGAVIGRKRYPIKLRLKLAWKELRG